MRAWMGMVVVVAGCVSSAQPRFAAGPNGSRGGVFGRRLRLSRPVRAVPRPAIHDAAIVGPGRPLEAAE